MLGDHISSDSVCHALFRREVVATTRLAHPNIAAALDADDCDGQSFLIMEYVEGPTLEAFTTASHGVPAPLARTILAQAAAALQYASQVVFAHRDVKPANMILSGLLPQSPDDPGSHVCAKLLDFGLARVPTHAPTANIMGTLPCVEGGTIGTLAFMSPAQTLNPHSADARSDQYTLGCTLFCALTHRLPFPGQSVREVVRKRLVDPPRRSSSCGRIERFRPRGPGENREGAESRDGLRHALRHRSVADRRDRRAEAGRLPAGRRGLGGRSASAGRSRT